MNSPYFIVPIVVFTLMFVIWIIRKGKCLLKSGIFGIVSLSAINLASFFTGIAVGVNYLTVCCAIVFGLPGVAMMLLLKLL